MSDTVSCVTCMHTHVLLQGVVVIAGLLTDGAHEVGGLGVGGHVGPQGGLPPKGLLTHAAVEGPLPRVGHQVGLQVGRAPENACAKVALIGDSARPGVAGVVVAPGGVGAG